MRKIKFRGKELIHHEWIYGGIAEDNLDNVVILPQEKWSNGGCVDKSTVGQFTGMYDMHNKEIYEGDILRNTPRIVTYQIGWNNEYGYWEAMSVNDRGNDTLHNIHDRFEVIGNIYDNPELLKGK